MQNGRIVVVTGGAGGIGSKIVDRFLANGDTVFAIDNRLDALKTLLGTRNAQDRLVAVERDVSKKDDTRGFADTIRAKAGRVDILINCAGRYPSVPFEKMMFYEWQQIIAINLSGAFLMVSSLLPLMKGRGWGRIVNIASASVFEGVVGQTHYVAAKSGLIGFSRSLAMEVGDYGITVNSIAPGLTVTAPVERGMSASMIEGQPALRAIKRDEQPEDLVGPVFFLASPAANFMSGHGSAGHVGRGAHKDHYLHPRGNEKGLDVVVDSSART
jgi:NAD(P)-dependent dehydrogenase (short-subunit alcohol dehydrogenase family)